ncbi:P-II family nitrogen regulator [Caproiciproducens sp. CPB-2]|uniref:P-II family nitrogen regulator n=1 Tax=unclassified Caproiciproducens TaxID=2643836 RepID=UPI0023DC77E3|nr:P-II family nitrogen regulator [Caproiciproducens sp. CPB-2]MDF1494058.1 P-II family nitrogen regulator [Caproiciproducens sp. CPB-2]
MKKIEAFIRPDQLEDIKEILDSLQLNGLSIMQVMGCGSQKGWKEFVRGTEVDCQFLPKIKIEMIVLDEQADTVVDSIVEKAYTGEYGDGKIFISDISDAVRIRTGERGREAIQ